jgi:hypothetical protein
MFAVFVCLRVPWLPLAAPLAHRISYIDAAAAAIANAANAPAAVFDTAHDDCD